MRCSSPRRTWLAGVGGYRSDDCAGSGWPQRRHRADRHERGTNALLLRPPDVIDFCFGTDSAAQHAARADEKGITPLWYPLQFRSAWTWTTPKIWRSTKQPLHFVISDFRFLDWDRVSYTKEETQSNEATKITKGFCILFASWRLDELNTKAQRHERTLRRIFLYDSLCSLLLCFFV